MPAVPKQARSAGLALVYVTIGALLDVWSAVYYVHLRRSEATDGPYLWCYGFFFTGLALIVIGLTVGQIGRSAIQAEVAPVSTAQVVAPPVAQPVPATPVNGTAQPTTVAPTTVATAANGTNQNEDDDIPYSFRTRLL